MLVRCLPASVQSARSVFEKNTHDLRAFHSITDSTDLTDASLGGRYCLPDSSTFIIGNPETASRVTLAALGIGFQPNLPSIQLNHKTTNQSGTQYQASDNP